MVTIIGKSVVNPIHAVLAVWMRVAEGLIIAHVYGQAANMQDALFVILGSRAPKKRLDQRSMLRPITMENTPTIISISAAVSTEKLIIVRQ